MANLDARHMPPPQFGRKRPIAPRQDNRLSAAGLQSLRQIEHMRLRAAE